MDSDSDSDDYDYRDSLKDTEDVGDRATSTVNDNSETDRFAHKNRGIYFRKRIKDESKCNSRSKWLHGRFHSGHGWESAASFLLGGYVIICVLLAILTSRYLWGLSAIIWCIWERLLARALCLFMRRQCGFHMKLGWAAVRVGWGYTPFEIELRNLQWSTPPDFHAVDPDFLVVQTAILIFDFQSVYDLIMRKPGSTFNVYDLVLDGITCHFEKENMKGQLNLWRILHFPDDTVPGYVEPPKEEEEANKGPGHWGIPIPLTINRVRLVNITLYVKDLICDLLSTQSASHFDTEKRKPLKLTQVVYNEDRLKKDYESGIYFDELIMKKIVPKLEKIIAKGFVHHSAVLTTVFKTAGKGAVSALKSNINSTLHSVESSVGSVGSAALHVAESTYVGSTMINTGATVVHAGGAVGDAVLHTGGAVGDAVLHTGSAVGSAVLHTGSAVGEAVGTCVGSSSKKASLKVGATIKKAKMTLSPAPDSGAQKRGASVPALRGGMTTQTPEISSERKVDLLTKEPGISTSSTKKKKVLSLRSMRSMKSVFRLKRSKTLG